LSLLEGSADFNVQRAVRVAFGALEDSGSHFWPSYFLSSPGVSAANADMNVHQVWSGTVPRHLRREQAPIFLFALIATIE
jgi:hypothetical protein